MLKHKSKVQSWGEDNVKEELSKKCSHCAVFHLKRIHMDSKSKWYAGLSFTTPQPSVLNIQRPAKQERQLLCWMLPMVTARLVVRAQVEMFSWGQGSFKASCNGKCFFKRSWSIRQANWHLKQTIVSVWFDVSHSEFHFFYSKSQISINTGLDCCEKIAAGLRPTHLCEPLRALWIDYRSSLVYTLCSPPYRNKTARVFHQKCYWKFQPQLYSHAANLTFQKYKPHSLIQHLRDILKQLSPTYS